MGEVGSVYVRCNSKEIKMFGLSFKDHRVQHLQFLVSVLSIRGRGLPLTCMYSFAVKLALNQLLKLCAGPFQPVSCVTARSLVDFRKRLVHILNSV